MMWREESGFLETFLAYYGQFEENVTTRKAYRDFLVEVLCAHEQSLGLQPPVGDFAADIKTEAEAESERDLSWSLEPNTSAAFVCDAAETQETPSDVDRREVGGKNSNSLEPVPQFSSSSRRVAEAMQFHEENVNSNLAREAKTFSSSFHEDLTNAPAEEFPKTTAPEIFLEDVRDLPHVNESERSGDQFLSSPAPQQPRLLCKVCHAFFPTIGGLQRHVCRNRERSCTCKFCGKAFHERYDLVKHELSHTREKRFTCSVCGKSFAGNSALVVHKRIHTGERPYACKYCKKSFTQLCGLQYHERTHTGEQPYVCDLCGKSFAASSSLAVHRRIHTGEQPYYCSVCGQTFRVSSKLRSHVCLQGLVEHTDAT